MDLNKPQIYKIYCDSEIAEILDREKQKGFMDSFEVINYDKQENPESKNMHDENETQSLTDLSNKIQEGGFKKDEMFVMSNFTLSTKHSTLSNKIQEGGLRKYKKDIISGGVNNVGKNTVGMFSDLLIEDLDSQTPVVVRDDSDLWLEPEEAQTDDSGDTRNQFNYFNNNVWRIGNNRFHQIKSKAKRLKKISKKSKQRNRK